MGVFDKFINAIRISDDDYDEDEFYDDDDLDADDDFEEEKPKKSFFSKRSSKYEDDDEDDFDDEPVSKKAPAQAAEQPKPAAKPVRSYPVSSKVTPIKRKNGLPMEVCVIKPTNMEDTREIADTLLANCTVVLNLEGIDIDLAQRVIDFTSGTCYSINGSLQKVSSYIFILTPASVDISGDITDILSSTAALR